MYRLQFCNAYTQEVLREVAYENEKKVKAIIEPLKSKNQIPGSCYILDSQKRLFQAEYVGDTVIHMADETVFRVFFKVKLNELQPLLHN